MTGRVEQFAGATIHLGDCLEILPSLPRPGAIVTDPPYEIDTRGAGKFRQARPYLDEIAAEDLDKGFDHSILSAWRADAVVVFCHNDQLAEILPILAVEFKRYAVCFWAKRNPMPVANKHYLPDLEIYVHAWAEGSHPIGELAEKKRWIELPVGKSEYDHPSVKPFELMRKIIRNVNASSICDPYMGTGTTGVAALSQGRTFVGIEIKEKYFDIACRRLEAIARRAEQIA